jgi:general stress protein 26
MDGTLDLAEVKRRIQSAENVYVSTINDEGYPVTRVMFNLHNTERFPKQAAFLAGLDEDFCIYLGTNTSSSKVSHLQRTPRMSIYYHEPGSWQAMLIAGEAEVVTDMAVKKGLWQDEWAMYYQGGVESEDFTIVRLRPVFAEYYHDLTKETLRFTDG